MNNLSGQNECEPAKLPALTTAPRSLCVVVMIALFACRMQHLFNYRQKITNVDSRPGLENGRGRMARGGVVGIDHPIREHNLSACVS